MNVPMRAGSHRLALLAVIAIAPACAGTRTLPAPPPPVPDLSTLSVHEAGVVGFGKRIPSSVRVLVRNENLVDVKVYAVSGEMVIPLGRVERFAEARLSIPDFCHMRTGVVRLMAAPVGYNQPVMARPVRVGPGSEINWVLKSGLSARLPNWRSTDD